MKVMIATPNYGGQCVAAFKRSCLGLESMLTHSGIDHVWMDTINESMITRGRDVIAAVFMNGDCDHLLFIDSDVDFTTEDAAHIIQMANNGVEVACGCYQTKKIGGPFIAYVDGRPVTWETLDAHDMPFNVDYAGTGFMLIKRCVFEKLRDAHPGWLHNEGKFEKEGTQVWAFFQDPIEDGIHLTEDYFFCKRVRELGVEIKLNPNVRLGHWGLYRFDGR